MNTAFLHTVRRALPLMKPPQRAEAEALLAKFSATANSANDTLSACAHAWEGDMQGVRTAIAAALHTNDKGYGLCPECGAPGANRERRPNGNDRCANDHTYPSKESVEPLRNLRKMLPFYLREANRAPALGSALARAMAEAIADPSVLERTANAVSISEEPGITAALEQWRSREVFETDLGSADLRGLSRELLNRSIFSARVTNADFLNEVGVAVDDILAGRTNMAQGRWRLLRKLKELGYDPMLGFPGDMANVPPAEAGSLQDLSSTMRLDLIIETNVRMASCYAQHLAGNTPYALHAYPAWELVRLFHRDVPRGSPESKSIGWERRWQDAAEAVAWEGVAREAFEKDGAMVALKDSPIWQALGDGAGGYTDTLGNPYPPFAFRSGKAWRPVNRARCVDLELISGDESPLRTEAQLSPGEKEVRAAADRLSPDLRAELERELSTDSEREFLDRTQAGHEAAQRAVRDERIRRAPEVQADHRARMAELTKGVE